MRTSCPKLKTWDFLGGMNDMNTERIAEYLWVGRNDQHWYRDCQELFEYHFGQVDADLWISRRADCHIRILQIHAHCLGSSGKRRLLVVSLVLPQGFKGSSDRKLLVEEVSWRDTSENIIVFYVLLNLQGERSDIHG